MPMTLSFSSLALPKTGSVLFLIPQGAKPSGLAAQMDKQLKGALTRAIKVQSFKGEKGKGLTLLAPEGTALKKVIVLGIGKIADLTETDFETIGGKAAGHASDAGALAICLESELENGIGGAEIAARVALGAQLGNYRFIKYKTKDKTKASTSKIVVATKFAARAKSQWSELSALSEGIMLARDLVNEPANILSPPEFARRTRALTKLGVKVEVLSEAQMKKLGMGSLLGVGQGSAFPSQMVVMQWNGAAKTKQPLAFVGKGVCFDTGGISIKPAGGMEDMKGDMGGAAAVTGLMHSLAKRKAKVNVVGVIGLVENMPSSTAQRPGDIVTSMSGQTIEVLNTDAEGRLVLADALWYTQKRFSPKFMIDLATLTGAIMIALGQDYAGMFSNDDKLCDQLESIGKREGEQVWRMPMNSNFDKMIDTPNADMKNIGGRYAGSSTAAQFLQRFVNNVPWVHLDIAGTAMGSPKSATSQSWASGYGVKLLDRLVKSHYE
jgi:leucyl aminopeptidase